MLKVLCGCSRVLGKPAGMVKGAAEKNAAFRFSGFPLKMRLTGKRSPAQLTACCQKAG